MNSTITLKTDFGLHPLEKINNLNSRQIMQKLLDRGYQDFILVDPYLEQLVGKIVLPIENDIEFILESYLYLEDLVLQKETFEHNTFLGDGVLEIKAKVSAGSVDIVYKYCPRLNRENLVIHQIKTNQENLLIWWRNLVYELAQFYASL